MTGNSQSVYDALRHQSLDEVREEIRSGAYQGHTAGLANGRLQCNLVILTTEFAGDFEEFCRINPKPCPLIAISSPGSTHIPSIGSDIDIRTDAPLYNVYRSGELSEQVCSLEKMWSEDFVVFALGCSFTFERALIEAGIPMRHIDMNTTVPMYKSAIETNRSGVFGGGMVVSMRPIKKNDVELAIEISERYPLAHGGPVHHGNPDQIGIGKLNEPDWGSALHIETDEVPVFWGCGVTPQSAILEAKLPFCITHAPGSMLITDVDEYAQEIEDGMNPPS